MADRSAFRSELDEQHACKVGWDVDALLVSLYWSGLG